VVVLLGYAVEGVGVAVWVFEVDGVVVLVDGAFVDGEGPCVAVFFEGGPVDRDAVIGGSAGCGEGEGGGGEGRSQRGLSFVGVVGRRRMTGAPGVLQKGFVVHVLVYGVAVRLIPTTCGRLRHPKTPRKIRARCSAVAFQDFPHDLVV